ARRPLVVQLIRHRGTVVGEGEPIEAERLRPRLYRRDLGHVGAEGWVSEKDEVRLTSGPVARHDLRLRHRRDPGRASHVAAQLQIEAVAGVVPPLAVKGSQRVPLAYQR